MADEREVQHDPQVLEGEDDLPRQPSPPLDPYTPEPGPSPGERRAFKLLPLAWIVVLVLAGIILYAVFRYLQIVQRVDGRTVDAHL
jgi:hypothetical protein